MGKTSDLIPSSGADIKYDAIVDPAGGGDFTSIYDAFQAGRRSLALAEGTHVIDDNIIDLSANVNDTLKIIGQGDRDKTILSLEPTVGGTDIFVFDRDFYPDTNANLGTGCSYDRATRTITLGTGTTTNLSAGTEVFFDDVYSHRKLGRYTVASVVVDTSVTFEEDIPLLDGALPVSMTFWVVPTAVTSGGGYDFTLANVSVVANTNVGEMFFHDNTTWFRSFILDNCNFDFTASSSDLFYDYMAPYNHNQCYAVNCVYRGQHGNFDSKYSDLIWRDCEFYNVYIFDDEDNQYDGCKMYDCNLSSRPFDANKPANISPNVGAYVQFTNNTLVNCVFGKNLTDNNYDFTASDVVNTSGTVGTLEDSDGTHTVTFDRKKFVKETLMSNWWGAGWEDIYSFISYKDWAGGDDNSLFVITSDDANTTYASAELYTSASVNVGSTMYLNYDNGGGLNSVYAFANNTGAYMHLRDTGGVKTQLYPSVADGASAVAYTFDTLNDLSVDGGAKIIQWNNQGTEVGYLNYRGVDMRAD
jgi:hypothetical protein